MDRHRHEFSDLIIRRISADNVNYTGTTGDKAYLAWQCGCGNSYAFDMGPVRDMFARYKQLKQDVPQPVAA